MHKLSIPPHVPEMVQKRVGKLHPYDTLVPSKTALLVVDMQNYFMHPSYQAVPMAQTIVPNVNRLADIVRAAGGHVVWIKTATDDTRDSWSNYHDHLMSREHADWRYTSMDTGHHGHALWDTLTVKPGDVEIVKKRFSAFIQDSSAIDAYLRQRGIDTLLIAGTTTNVCCESTARDAMMLNYKVVMVHDALAAYTDAEHNATLATFYMIFGDVQSIDEAAQSLQRGTAKA